MSWRAAMLALALALAGCARGGGGEGPSASKVIPVTIIGPAGHHDFRVELARTAAQQERGLMYRNDIGKDGGMLFAPYPPDGGPPRAATFWMKNTPSPLDIIFIRANGTIARIANAVPFDETPLMSGEPVAAVLELKGGRTAALGINEGDKVNWAR